MQAKEDDEIKRMGDVIKLAGGDECALINSSCDVG